MHCSAVLALAEILVAVELLKKRRQVAHDALQFHLSPTNEVITILAIPLKAIQFALWPRHLDHYTHSSRLQSLWRMPHVFRQQKNFSLLDRYFNRRLSWSLDQPQKDVALELIKEFLGGIVMIVSPVIRTANHGHHHLSVFPHLGVAYRRLELLFILFNPIVKIERF